MYLSSQSRTTVETCIDALCFQATHAIDDDGSVYLKESLPKLLQLRDDQAARMEQSYGPKELHPDSLAEQLMELYGADAQSLMERVDVTEPSVVDNLTDVTAKIFKKEMKQRIHDWEGSFRATYGREAGPHDKMRLRAIYELYKAVKNRVLSGPNTGNSVTVPSTVAPSVPPPPQQQARVSTPAPRPTSATTTPLRTLTPDNDRATPTTSASRGYGAGPTASLRSTPLGVSPSTPAAAAANNVTPMGSRPSSAGSAHAAAAHTDPTAAAPALTLQSLGLSSLAEAQQEKRALKRQLHEFEDRFKQEHGRPPSKDDRRPFQREYHRYGELKAFLATMGQGGD